MSKLGGSDAKSHFLLLNTGKTVSFSVRNTLEKKSHKTSAFPSSFPAIVLSLLSVAYFKSPMGSLLFVLALTYFQKCLGLFLQVLAISF